MLRSWILLKVRPYFSQSHVHYSFGIETWLNDKASRLPYLGLKSLCLHHLWSRIEVF